jgi:hypothetical protein
MRVNIRLGKDISILDLGSCLDLVNQPMAANRRMVVCWIRIALPVVAAAVVPNRGYAWKVSTSAAATAHRAYYTRRTVVGLTQFQSSSRSTLRRSYHHHHNVVALTPCHGQRRSNDNDRDTTSDLTTGSDTSDEWLAVWVATLFRPLPAVALHLALIFPLALAFMTVLVPLQALCTALLFALLRTAASQLIPFAEFEKPNNTDDDSEEIWNDDTILQLQIDGTTFILSFVSAALLVPADLDFDDAASQFTTGPALILVLMAVVAAVAVAVVGWMQVQTVVQQVVKEEQLSDADKQLNTWDRKFRQSRSDQDDNTQF